MARWAVNYGVNLEPQYRRLSVGGCPYGSVPPTYAYYNYASRRQLSRRFCLTEVTFGPENQFTEDGGRLSMYLKRYGESCYGTFLESAGVRVYPLTFEVGVSEGYVPVIPGAILVDLFGLTTAEEVRDAWYDAMAAIPISFVYRRKVDTDIIALWGVNQASCADDLVVIGYPTTAIDIATRRTMDVGCPPLAAIGGGGAIMAPMDRRDSGPATFNSGGELLFGNHQIV